MPSSLLHRLMVCLVGYFATLVVPALAQITLSGASMWQADATGANNGVTGYGNTLGSDGDSSGVFNVYMFTGSTGSPSFLTSGSTNASLNPNLSLPVGTHVISFALQNAAPSFVGINLYFDGNLASNRISAFVPYDGTNNFSVISAASTTIAEGAYGALQAGSGSLSWTAGGRLVTVTDMNAGPSTIDLVGSFTSPANGSADIVATMTLTVTAVPEPASSAVVSGLAAVLAALVYRRASCTGAGR